MHDVSNRDIHLCPRHNRSSVHLITTSEVRRSGRITNGMRSGWTTLRDSVISSPTPTPTLQEWPCREKRGFGLTASAPVSDVSAHASQMGHGPFCGLWEWRWRTNRRPCIPPVSNPSTSTRTARPDGSGWWDDCMAAKHLPWDLVRPSSGLKELAQTTTTSYV